MDNNNSSQDTKNKADDVVDFSLKEFFSFCLRKWFWFAICLAFSVGIALFYIYRKQPEYNRYEQILVNEQDSNGGVGEISNAFSSLGLFSKNTNVYNELLALTSPAVLYQVADSLQLDMNYVMRDGLKYKTLYGSSLPFRIDMEDIDKQGSASFKIKTQPDGSMTFYKFRKYDDAAGRQIKYPGEVKVSPSQNLIQTPIGLVKFTPNPNYTGTLLENERDINVSKGTMQGTVEYYSTKLSGDLADDDADVIELSIDDVSVERATDILNYILIIYNQNWVSDKNRMAMATSRFIDDRLRVIQAELGDVDQSIADYIKKTGTPDMKTTISTSVELGSKLEQDLINVSNELSVANYMKEFLANNSNNNTVLPTNLGISGNDLAKQISEYNELLFARNNILVNSSESNPLVQNYNQQLSQMKNAIAASINNRISNLQTTSNHLRGELGKLTSTMATLPQENLPLLSEERQQLIKEKLYLFLLQKREENELTQKFSADNIRIITPPVGSLRPVSPKKGLIIIVACILGFGIPLIVLYYLESSNTTVRSKKDLDNILMPFAGEIPQVGKKSDLKKLAEKNPLKKPKDEAPMTVVEEGKRDIVNEAFRVIRGNLDFMSGKNADHQVMMLTSFNPGSGKSFIAYNLGMSFAIKGKKVLIIDCDLRHGSASMYVNNPSKGVTEYLNGSVTDWESLVVKVPANPNLSIMPIGKIPPNPAELLEDGKLENLISETKKDYDIVLLDCPPVNIVVDTQIVAPYAERTLFVVRAGLLDRSELKELNRFYQDKKFNNMCVILNGTENAMSSYHHYGTYHYHS